jgi:hypothetical protein
VSRRGTHRTNKQRIARAVQAGDPGRSYQQIVQQLDKVPSLETEQCVRCGDRVVAGRPGTWCSVEDLLCFCDEFVAHDELDVTVGPFSPSHQPDPAGAAVEDAAFAVHVSHFTAGCERCAVSPAAPSLGDLLDVTEKMVLLAGGQWLTLDRQEQLALLIDVLDTWDAACGPPHHRHSAVRRTVREHLESRSAGNS